MTATTYLERVQPMYFVEGIKKRKSKTASKVLRPSLAQTALAALLKHVDRLWSCFRNEVTSEGKLCGIASLSEDRGTRPAVSVGERINCDAQLETLIEARRQNRK